MDHQGPHPRDPRPRARCRSSSFSPSHPGGSPGASIPSGRILQVRVTARSGAWGWGTDPWFAPTEAPWR